MSTRVFESVLFLRFLVALQQVAGAPPSPVISIRLLRIHRFPKWFRRTQDHLCFLILSSGRGKVKAGRSLYINLTS